MERLTYYDYFSNCYKIKPDAPQRLIIQKLGKYEDGNNANKTEALKKLLEEVRAEKLTSDVFKSTDWITGYIEGLNVADELIRGLIDD